MKCYFVILKYNLYNTKHSSTRPVDEVLILTKGAMVLHPHPHPGVDLCSEFTPAWKTVRPLCAWLSKNLVGYKRAKAKCFQDSRATHKLVDWGKGLGPEQDTCSHQGQILGDRGSKMVEQSSGDVLAQALSRSGKRTQALPSK